MMPTKCHRNMKAMDLRPVSNSLGPGEGGLWVGRDSARGRDAQGCGEPEAH